MHAGGEQGRSRRRGFEALACAVVVASAFLLFSLELITARAVLPRFGGSPMVWTTSMLVYQALLLVGYLYAHGLASVRSGTVQAVTHAALLAAAAAFAWVHFHVTALTGGDPAVTSRNPVVSLFASLLAVAALPFVAVSATSPLAQHWLQRLEPRRSVYWLYGASNAGSFAGLVAYLVMIEPLIDLQRQFRAWTALFALTALGLGVLAAVARQAQPRSPDHPASAGGDPPAARPTPARRALWLLLPAGTSALLLAATNELCTDLAVFPFLWVLPLGLYLLSFTLTFRSRPLPHLVGPAAMVTLVALATTSMGPTLPAPAHMASIGALVLALCLAAHREVYRLRPPPAQLTAYYAWMSAGSIIGALGVALLAPVLFLGYWEFQSAILFVWLTVAAAAALDRDGALRSGDPRHTAALLGIVVFLAVNQVPERWIVRHLPIWPAHGSLALRLGLSIALAAVLWFTVLRRRAVVRRAVWARVLVGLIVFFVECSLVQRVRADRTRTGPASRNFFGVIRVQEVLHPETGIRVRQLTHGRINHGWQYVNPELRQVPTAYHSPSSGIGRLLRACQARRPAIRIGVTGLGAGALAAYPRAADRIVFYEIDPPVVALSTGRDAAFTFLNACSGRLDVVLGDARQSLSAERARDGSRDYDVLALDAFSSDAIPTHLLTREAMRLYLDHLARPDGVLAVNISNRFLDIEPVLADTAAMLGLHGLLIDSLGDPPVRARSVWVLLSKNATVLEDPAVAAVGRPLTADRLAWTDTRASPFALLKWWTPTSRHLRFTPRRRDAAAPATAPARSPSQTPGQPEG